MEEKNLSVKDFEKLSKEQADDCLTNEEIKSETKENYDKLEQKFWRTLKMDQNP